MSLRLAVAERCVPAPLRRRGLDELADAAAAGFGCPRPPWRGRRYEDRLDEFARFTADQAVLAAEAGRDSVVRDDLRRHADELGRRLRRRLGVRSHDESLRALRVLYRQLQIDLRARSATTIEVSSCLFSRVYDASACRIVSAVDEGIAAGLTGGCELRFERRITEGASTCVATLVGPGSCARSS